MNEAERILQNNNGELPNNALLKFKIRTNEPLKHLILIKEVMIKLAKLDQMKWITDEDGKNIFPEWFINKIISYSFEEIKKNKSLWDYGSWLDAMKFRGWEWWSAKVEKDYFEINLQAITFPYSVDPLEYVIYSTGVNSTDILFEK